MRKYVKTGAGAACMALAMLLAACSGTKTTSGTVTAETESTADMLQVDTENGKNGAESSEEMQETEASDVSSETGDALAATQEAESQPESAVGVSERTDLSPAYAEKVKEYRTMIREKWDLAQVFNTELSSMIPNFYDIGAEKAVGYTLFDLDGDGKKELLIGETDTKLPVNRIIFDAYTLKNNQAEQLFVSHERNLYYLVEDSGTILVANEGANGAANSGWLYYTVKGDKMNVVQAVIYDAFADEENPWFLAKDDDWDTSNDTPIDEAQAQGLIDSYTENYAKLDWIPIME